MAKLIIVIFRRDRGNPKLCRHLLISDVEKIKSSFLLDEVNIRMEQFIDEKFTTGLIIIFYYLSKREEIWNFFEHLKIGEIVARF